MLWWPDLHRLGGLSETQPVRFINSVWSIPGEDDESLYVMLVATFSIVTLEEISTLRVDFAKNDATIISANGNMKEGKERSTDYGADYNFK